MGPNHMIMRASLVAQLVKSLPPMRETWVPSLGWEDPLEREMATHSSILAWRIPWNIQWSGGLPSRTQLSHVHFHIIMGFPSGSEGKEFTCNVGDLGSISGLGRSAGGEHGNPLQYSCLENSHGQEPDGLQSMGL